MNYVDPIKAPRLSSKKALIFSKYRNFDLIVTSKIIYIGRKIRFNKIVKKAYNPFYGFACSFYAFVVLSFQKICLFSFSLCLLLIV